MSFGMGPGWGAPGYGPPMHMGPMGMGSPFAGGFQPGTLRQRSADYAAAASPGVVHGGFSGRREGLVNSSGRRAPVARTQSAGYAATGHAAPAGSRSAPSGPKTVSRTVSAGYGQPTQQQQQHRPLSAGVQQRPATAAAQPRQTYTPQAQAHRQHAHRPVVQAHPQSAPAQSIAVHVEDQTYYAPPEGTPDAPSPPKSRQGQVQRRARGSTVDRIKHQQEEAVRKRQAAARVRRQSVSSRNSNSPQSVPGQSPAAHQPSPLASGVVSYGTDSDGSPYQSPTAIPTEHPSSGQLSPLVRQTPPAQEEVAVSPQVPNYPHSSPQSASHTAQHAGPAARETPELFAAVTASGSKATGLRNTHARNRGKARRSLRPQVAQAQQARPSDQSPTKKARTDLSPTHDAQVLQRDPVAERRREEEFRKAQEDAQQRLRDLELAAEQGRPAHEPSTSGSRKRKEDEFEEDKSQPDLYPLMPDRDEIAAAQRSAPSHNTSVRPVNTNGDISDFAFATEATPSVTSDASRVSLKQRRQELRANAEKRRELQAKIKAAKEARKKRIAEEAKLKEQQAHTLRVKREQERQKRVADIERRFNSRYRPDPAAPAPAPTKARVRRIKSAGYQEEQQREEIRRRVIRRKALEQDTSVALHNGRTSLHQVVENGTGTPFEMDAQIDSAAQTSYGMTQDERVRRRHKREYAHVPSRYMQIHNQPPARRPATAMRSTPAVSRTAPRHVQSAVRSRNQRPVTVAERRARLAQLHAGKPVAPGPKAKSKHHARQTLEEELAGIYDEGKNIPATPVRQTRSAGYGQTMPSSSKRAAPATPSSIRAELAAIYATADKTDRSEERREAERQRQAEAERRRHANYESKKVAATPQRTSTTFVPTRGASSANDNGAGAGNNTAAARPSKSAVKKQKQKAREAQRKQEEEAAAAAQVVPDSPPRAKKPAVVPVTPERNAAQPAPAVPSTADKEAAIAKARARAAELVKAKQKTPGKQAPSTPAASAPAPVSPKTEEKQAESSVEEKLRAAMDARREADA